MQPNGGSKDYDDFSIMDFDEDWLFYPFSLSDYIVCLIMLGLLFAFWAVLWGRLV